MEPIQEFRERHGALSRSPSYSSVLAWVLAVFAMAWGSSRGTWAIAAAMTVGCLSGLEVSIREHFDGYRPHTAVLAGTTAVLGGTATFALGAPAPIDLGLTLIIFRCRTGP